LMPVVFKHACEEHKDILDTYLDVDEGEMDDDSKKTKKSKKESENLLMKDWPRGEAASPVTRFIDSYVKKLLTLNTSWRNFSDYFAVIEAFAGVGPQARAHLLARHTVGLLVDFYLFEDSPLVAECKLKRDPMGDKKSSPDFTRLFDAVYACLVDVLPISAYFMDLADKGFIPSPLLPDLDRRLLIRSSFIGTALDQSEASPGLSLLLCSCCVESLDRTNKVMKCVLNHLSFPEYHSLVFLMLDIKDSLKEKRADLLLEGLARVTDYYPAPSYGAYGAYGGAYGGGKYNDDYVTDKDKGEALLMMAELADNEKDGNTVIDKVFAVRDKWLSSCLVSNLEPPVRQSALQLLTRCIQLPSSTKDSPAWSEERAAQALESLMRLITEASRCLVAPARVANAKYHPDYDWRLTEYANAVKMCLFNEKLRGLFGGNIVRFAELVQSLDKYHRVGDKSKWALFEVLMEGIRETPSNLEKILNSKTFTQGLANWSIGPEKDSDKDIAMFCELLNKLAEMDKKILFTLLNGQVVFWLLSKVAFDTKRFPVSSKLTMSFVHTCLSVPEVSRPFIGSLFQAALSQFEWRDILSNVNVIASLKTEFCEMMSTVFWSDVIVKQFMEALRNSPECFLPLCKLLSFFVQDCPLKYKLHVVRYVVSSHNCFVNTVMEQDFPALPEEMDDMEKDLDTVLTSLCSSWQNGAMMLFNALVSQPLRDDEHLIVGMTVNSPAIDKAVHRLLEQGLAESSQFQADAAVGARRILFGMCLAYLVVCSREMKTIPQLIADVRSNLALGPSDPAIGFGAERVAFAMLCTIESTAFSPETESLLADCFSKSIPFEVNDNLMAIMKEAMEFVKDLDGLQKIFILAHSPVLARCLEQYLDIFEGVAKQVGKESDKYITAIRQFVTLPSPPTPPAPSPPVIETDGPQHQMDVPMDDSPEKTEQHKEVEDAAPLGLPPTEPDDDESSKSTEME